MSDQMQIPKIMKSVQIVKPGNVVWDDAPVPAPDKNQVLVKVIGVTTCPHWDMHIMSGEPMFPGSTIEYPYQPGQPGHEAMGQVVAVGEGVQNFEIGMYVACWRDQGHNRPGCYAQYVVVEAENLIAIPGNAVPQEYASLELAMCVRVSFQQLERIGSLEGKTIGVSGLGPAGLIAVQMALAGGAKRVVAIDPVASRRDLAGKLGAELVIAPDDPAFPEGRKKTDETALDMAVDCTGLKKSIEYLMARSREAVAIFGVLREEISFGPEHFGGLALLGYKGHNFAAASEALNLIKAGKLDLTPLVTHKLPLSQYEKGVSLLKEKKAIKVCFLPWE